MYNNYMEDSSFRHFGFATFAFIFGAGAIWAVDQGSAPIISFVQDKTGFNASKIQASLANFFEDNTSPTPTYSPKVVEPSIFKTKNDTLKIVIGGDTMFDRKVRQLGQTNGYDTLLAPVAPLFDSADIAVVNLEGPVTSFPSKTLRPDGSTTKELVFTFDPESLEALKNVGVDVVSLSNNHTDNFGTSGFLQTKANLASTGIQYFGDPWNASSTELLIEKNGMKVAFVGYHSFQKGFDRVLAKVNELSNNNYFVIVMPHWGEEYKKEPSDTVRNQARLLAAAGAGAVIGGHSHIIGENEWLDGIPVYYSLGNLLFDQYFSPEVMKGLVVELRLSKSNDGVRLDSLKSYEVSTASRKHVELIGETEE